MTSVQLRLRGGWKTLLINSGVYALIVFGAMGLWAQLDQKHIKRVAVGWTVLLMLVQVGLVMLFSIVRVAGSVRQDNSSGIMESHRLMPVSGLTACIGYIIGPIGQMLAIGTVTCFAGAVSSFVAGINPERWMVSNAILLVFMIFSCMCAVLVGFYRRAIFNSLIVLVIVGFFSRGWVLIALPATAVLVSPLAGETIFNFQANTNLFGAGVACAFLGQACVGAIMLAAAARKFRQPDRPAFSISLAFVLLGVWVALNLAGMLQWGAFEPRFLRFVLGPTDDPLPIQFTGSVLTTILLSLLPLSVAIRSPQRAAESSRRVAIGVGAIVICSLLACLLLLVPIMSGVHPRWQSIGIVAFSIVATIVNFGSLLLAYRSSARTAATWLVVFIIVTWIGPLFADTIVHQLMDQYVADRAPWSITAFGPIGTMLSPWQPEIQTTAGLGCQIGIVAAMMLIASIAESKRRRRTMRSNDVTELAIGLT